MLVLVLVLVLVLDECAIGDANGALDQGCLLQDSGPAYRQLYLYSSPFKYLWGQRMRLLRAVLG